MQNCFVIRQIFDTTVSAALSYAVYCEDNCRSIVYCWNPSIAMTYYKFTSGKFVSIQYLFPFKSAATMDLSCLRKSCLCNLLIDDLNPMLRSSFYRESWKEYIFLANTSLLRLILTTHEFRSSVYFLQTVYILQRCCYASVSNSSNVSQLLCLWLDVPSVFEANE